MVPERNIRSVTVQRVNFSPLMTTRKDLCRRVGFLTVSLLTIAISFSFAYSQTGDVIHQDLMVGQRLYREGRYAEASLALKAAVKRNKNDVDAWYYLGLCYLRQSDFKSATKAFQTGLRLKPDSAAVHTGLALTFLLRNKLKDALRESERAVALDSTNTDAHFVLGMVKLHIGKKEQALAEAELAIRLNDKFAAGYLLKTQALVSFGRDVIVADGHPATEYSKNFQEAAVALEKYLQLTPDSSEKESWAQQLEALRFHVALRSEAGRKKYDVYNGREVTTKARLLSKPEPTYTSKARAHGVTGIIVLRCIFAADATVKHIVVLSGLPDGLTWQAIEAARRIQFQPAILNGKPVSIPMQLEYNFNLY